MPRQVNFDDERCNAGRLNFGAKYTQSVQGWNSAPSVCKGYEVEI
ncbi:hypothetical protein [uncultured Campylobacter sp.]|nr:hypothetical protein [uncultured Campylobacter sp.]